MSIETFYTTTEQYEQAWDLRRRDVALSEQLAAELLKTALVDQDFLAMAQANIVLAVHSGYKGDLDTCYQLASGSLDAFIAYGDYRSQTRAYNVMGYVHIVRNDLGQAFEILLRGLLVAKEFNQTEMQIFFLYNIGEIYKNTLQLHHKALDYLMEAQEVAYKSQPTHPLLAGIHASIALCLQKANRDHAEQHDHINRALELSEIANDLQTKSICFHMLALINLENKDFDQANSYLQQEYQLLSKIDDPYGVVNTQLIEVQLLNMQGHYKEAISLAIIALKVAQLKQYDALIFHFYKALAYAYMSIGQFEKAAINYRLYSEAFEHTMSLEVENRMAMMATEIKIKEQAQKLQAKMRDSHMAALTELVNGVAHEINTPLGNAITMASFLTDELKSLDDYASRGNGLGLEISPYIEQAHIGFEMLQGSLAKTAAIVEGFKKISMDYHMLDLSSFEVGSLFEELALLAKPYSRQNQIKIIFEAPEHLVIESYEKLINYALLQLIENAERHGFLLANTEELATPTINELGASNSKENQILVIAQCINFNTEVAFTVMDNGVGISSVYLERIFNPFFTTKKAHGGLGLGLNIVYNLVTQVLRGKIEVTSEVDQGSQFKIILPRRMPL